MKPIVLFPFAVHHPAGRAVKLFLPLLLALLLAHTVASAGIFDDLSSLDRDTYVHFGAGVLISHVSYPLFLHYTRDRTAAMWYALGLTALLSVGKEVYDMNRTGFNGSDCAAGILGGCTIVVVNF
jgi:hypothetical protein